MKPLTRFVHGRLIRCEADGSVEMITAWPELQVLRRSPGERFAPAISTLPRHFLTNQLPLRADPVRFHTNEERLDRAYSAFEQVRKQDVDWHYFDGGISWPELEELVTEHQCRLEAEGFGDEQAAQAAWQFSQGIPPNAVAFVREFKDSHVELLQALAQIREAEHLLWSSGPALFLAVTRNDIFASTTLTERLAFARRLMAARRRDILGELGFPASDALVRALGRLPAVEVSVPALLKLRELITTDSAVVKFLCHQAQLHKPGRLSVMLESWGVFYPRIVATLLGLEGERLESVREVFADMARMARMLALPWPPARPLGGIGALERLHDELSRATLNCPASDLTLTFPAPPFPGVEGIQPICTPGELLEEGRQMSHCVAAFAPEIAGGDYFVYRVVGTGAAERATLGLQRTHRQWRVHQLKGSHNAKPPPAVQRLVHDWLARTQPSGSGDERR